VEVTLSAPISVDGNFPMLDQRPGTHRRYFTYVEHVRATGVRTIGIWVDVVRRRVVGVDPTFGDGVRLRSSRVVGKLVPGPRAAC
jgi:hypothetical protein